MTQPQQDTGFVYLPENPVAQMLSSTGTPCVGPTTVVSAPHVAADRAPFAGAGLLHCVGVAVITPPPPPPTAPHYSRTAAFTGSGTFLTSASPITHGLQINGLNTGLAGANVNPGSLTEMDTTTVTEDGTVLENIHFIGRLTIDAQNVTVRNCLFDFDDYFQVYILSGSSNWRMEWCTLIGHALDGIAVEQGAPGVGYRLNISGMENGLNMGAGSLIECYLHDPMPEDGEGHRDQIEIYGGGDIEIIRCWIAHDAEETGTLNMTGDFGQLDGVLVQDCFLDGGNYTIYNRAQGAGQPRNIQILGTAFGGNTNPYVGRFAIMSSDAAGTADPAVQAADPDRFVWRNNFWAHTGDSSLDGTSIPIPPPRGG